MTNRLSKYTEELHIEGLKLLLSQEDPCTYCPKNLIKRGVNIHNFFLSHCHICRNFIGIDNNSYFNCPCNALGKEEAIKLTWIRLEEVLDKNDPFFNNEEYNYDERT